MPPLLADSQPPAGSTGSAPLAADAGDPAAATHVRRKRKRRRHREGIADWESHSQSGDKHGENRLGRLTLVAGLLFLVAIMAVVILAMRISDTDAGRTASEEGPRTLQPTVPASLPGEEEPPPTSRTLSQFVSEARTVATTFLHATTVDELLEVVARPDLVEARMRQYYPDGIVEPAGLANYNQFTQMETTEAYVIVQVHTANHLARLMSFLEGDDGLKVDWESWVGWADLPMEDFIKQRPSGRHVFRVRLGAVEYYNFGFSDDRQWQSFRLASPDGDHSLFGYAERATQPHLKVREALDSEKKQVIVEVEFPESDDPTGRQVVITDVLSQNWIHPDRITAP